MQCTVLRYGDKGQIFIQHNDNRGRCLCNMLGHSQYSDYNTAWMVQASNPVGARDFSLQNVQTGPEAKLNGYECPFLGIKQPRHEVNQSFHPVTRLTHLHTNFLRKKLFQDRFIT
jgi:hypothetical protein